MLMILRGFLSPVCKKEKTNKVTDNEYNLIARYFTNCKIRAVTLLNQSYFDNGL